MSVWSPQALAAIAAAGELEIAARRADGTAKGFVPIWVVTVGGAVYVRSWHRRDTGWFGAAVASKRAQVRVPGVTAEVEIADAGVGSDETRRVVDDAYRAKYGQAGAESMVTDAVAATTLRLEVSSSAPSAP